MKPVVSSASDAKALKNVWLEAKVGIIRMLTQSYLKSFMNFSDHTTNCSMSRLDEILAGRKLKPTAQFTPLCNIQGKPIGQSHFGLLLNVCEFPSWCCYIKM